MEMFALNPDYKIFLTSHYYYRPSLRPIKPFTSNLAYFLRSLSFLMFELVVNDWPCRSSAAAFFLLKEFISSSKVFLLSSNLLFSSACKRFSCSNLPCNCSQKNEMFLEKNIVLYLNKYNFTSHMSSSTVDSTRDLYFSWTK